MCSLLSPHLFSMYGEMNLRSIMGVEGISTRGVNINIRYADDAVVTADTAEKLQALLDIVRERAREWD